MSESFHPDDNRELKLVIGITVLAFFIRMLFSFGLFPNIAGSLNLGWDPDLFGQLAQNWAEGEGYVRRPGEYPSTFRGPGYPAFLATVYLVMGDLYPGAVIAQSLIGALVCLPVFQIGKRLFDSRIGYASSLLVALHPLLIWYTPRLRYELLLTLLLAFAILYSVKLLTSQSMREPLLMGLFFGFATLVNQVVLPLPVIFIVTFFFLKARTFLLVKQSAVVLISMAVVIVPWSVRNYVVSGSVIPVHSGGVMQFVKGNYEYEHYSEARLQSMKLNELGDAHIADLLGEEFSEFDIMRSEVDQAMMPYALDSLVNEPEKLISKIIVQTPRFWYLSETPTKSWTLGAIQAMFLLPAFAGAIHVVKTNRQGLILILTILFFNIAYASTSATGRYSTPVIPYVSILAVVGALLVVQWIRKSRLEWSSQDFSIPVPWNSE